MSKIEIGEYVRTSIAPEILKIIEVRKDNRCITDKYSNLILQLNRDFTKHSKNIIDLIEVGDIVTTNNLCGEVTKIGKDKLYLACNETCCIDNVETILTHEQYEGNSYKVVE